MSRSHPSNPAANVRTIGPALLRRWPLPLRAGDDKDARGRAFIVGGAPEMPGAIVLAGTAALRAGAGKLQIGTCASVAAHVATAVPEALVRSFAETPAGGIASTCAADIAERANGADAVVIGPGMVDPPACGVLIPLVTERLTVPAVLDAAALNCLADRPDMLRMLGGRAVLTPHAGEMAAMLGHERASIEAEPVAHVIAAARRFHAVIALKGAQTYIATPDGEVYVNRAGHIGLATSGSGDTLAGIVGGILARGAAPLHATAWGVFLHAQAGATLARKLGLGFLARELLAEIPPIMRRLSASSARRRS